MLLLEPGNFDKILHFSHASPTGEYCPASNVSAFLHNIGPALLNMKCLDLYLEEAEGYQSMMLDGALLSLAGRALQDVRVSLGRLSPILMQGLGMNSPRLTTLGLFAAGAEDESYLEELMQLQPVLLPRVHTLVLQLDVGHSYILPDMAVNTSILTLDLSTSSLTDNGWLLLPPNLCHLKCRDIEVGPQPTYEDDSPFLPNLLSVTVGTEACSNLHSIAKFLRAAPAIQTLWSENQSYENVSIHCYPITAEDLSTLHGRMDLELVDHEKAEYRIVFTDGVDPGETSGRQFLLTLPLMPGIIRCDFKDCRVEDMPRLLDIFCDVQHLRLHRDHLQGMELCFLGYCQQIRTLDVTDCGSVDPMGFAMLCLQLPLLHTVITKMTERYLVGVCSPFFLKFGRKVVFTDT